MGINATTRLSTAAVSHVVHPRLEAPATAYLSILLLVICDTNAVTVSIALTAAFTIGFLSGSSPFVGSLTKSYHVLAIIASSDLLFLKS